MGADIFRSGDGQRWCVVCNAVAVNVEVKRGSFDSMLCQGDAHVVVATDVEPVAT